MELPDLFGFRGFENFQRNRFRYSAKFDFTAPGTEVPNNFRLEGADAKDFVAELRFGEPDANGVRESDFVLVYPSNLNFELPRDDNKDNLYEFAFKTDFQGETLSANVKFTVTDVDDNAEAFGKAITANINDQKFGNDISLIDDISGDSLRDIGVSIISGAGDSTAYVINSQAIASLPSSETTVSDLTDSGARFIDSQLGNGPENNRVSTSGTDKGKAEQILLSEAEKNRLVLINTPNGISGNIDAETASGRHYYQFATTERPIGQLISDINNDGIDDIFVNLLPETSANGDIQGTVGIIFGENSATVDRDAEFDISMTLRAPTTLPPPSTNSPDFDSIFPFVTPDADGDGLPDLFISFPGRDIRDEGNYHTVGKFWALKSALFTSGKKSIDLDNLLADEGLMVNATALDIELGDDFDGDGFPSILYTTYDTQFYISYFVKIRDLNDFFSPNGESYGALVQGTENNSILKISDLDDDGLSDYLVNGTMTKSLSENIVRERFRLINGGYVLTSTSIKEILSLPGRQLTIRGDDQFFITFNPDADLDISYDLYTGSPPIFLEDSNKLILGIGSHRKRIFERPEFTESISFETEGHIAILDLAAAKAARDAGEIGIRYSLETPPIE